MSIANCNGQNKYFEPTGIIDKTEELIKNKISWISLNNKERVDNYTRIGDSIFCGEIACNVKPMQGIDINTFQVWAGSQYARDKNKIYYPLQTVCKDWEDCGVCYCAKCVVENAKLSTFRYLEKDYATDGISVYFRGELIIDADGTTFKVIEGPDFFYFATDKKKVYIHEKVFEGADPMTFYYDKGDSRNSESESNPRFIIGDKDNEWEFIPPRAVKKIEKK